MILWPFPVDWKSGFSATYAYLTEVKLSRSGREQRRALRATPRQTREWTSQCWEAEFLALKRLLTKSADAQMVAADVVRRAVLAAPAASGAYAINLAEVPVWLVPGRYLVIGEGRDLHLAQVESVSGVTVTLESPLDFSLSAEAKVWAGVIGYPKQPLIFSQSTSQIGVVRVQFEVDPGSEPILTGSAEATYGGREAFVRKPNWREAVSVEVTRPMGVLDYDSGLVTRFAERDFTTFVRDGVYQANSVDDVDYFVAFFERMRGRQGEFVAPRFERDMDLADPLAAGSAQMRVVGAATAEAYADDPVHQALLVCLHNGTRIYRQIDTLVADGDESVFTLTTTWPANVAINDVLYVTWAPVCRLGSDELTVNWITAEIAEIKMAHAALEALDPES